MITIIKSLANRGMKSQKERKKGKKAKETTAGVRNLGQTNNQSLF